MSKFRGYSPRFKDTDKRFSTDSFTYQSLESSVRHRPCFLKRLSDTSLLAAAVAPPALRLCVPYAFGSRPILSRFDFNKSFIVEYENMTVFLRQEIMRFGPLMSYWAEYVARRRRIYLGLL